MRWLAIALAAVAAVASAQEAPPSTDEAPVDAEPAPPEQGGARLAEEPPIPAPPELPPPLDFVDAHELPPEDPLAAAAYADLGDAVTGPTMAAWVELGLTQSDRQRGATGEDTTALSGEVGLRLPIVRELVAEVRWGLTAGFADVRGQVMDPVSGETTGVSGDVTRVEPGNPVFTALAEGRPSERLVLGAGLGVAIATAARPEVASDAETLLQRSSSEGTHQAAAALRGWWDAWRWRPERLGLALPLRLAVDLEGGPTIEAEAAAALLFPVIGERMADTDLVLQAAVGVAWRLGDVVELGARLSVVTGAASGSSVPDVQAALMPWARLRLGRGRLGVRVIINAGSDHGFGASPDGGATFGAPVGVLLNGGAGF
jgi:hypothetical protein